MEKGINNFQTGLSDTALARLKSQLTNLVEPLNDGQLLELADGIHEMLRQRRMVRQHHAERMSDRVRHDLDLRI